MSAAAVSVGRGQPFWWFRLQASGCVVGCVVGCGEEGAPIEVGVTWLNSMRGESERPLLLGVRDENLSVVERVGRCLGEGDGVGVVDRDEVFP